jgi:hypothetical protein
MIIQPVQIACTFYILTNLVAKKKHPIRGISGHDEIEVLKLQLIILKIFKVSGVSQLIILI